MCAGDSIAQMVSRRASSASFSRFNFQHSPKKIQTRKLAMLLKLINGAAKRKVDSGLKIMIEPI